MTNLRQLRKERGLSQTQLSALTGIPQTTISGWERGIGEPTISEAFTLAQCLGTSVESLFGYPKTDEKLNDAERKPKSAANEIA